MSRGVAVVVICSAVLGVYGREYGITYDCKASGRTKMLSGTQIECRVVEPPAPKPIILTEKTV